mmetsp:Transcript_13723/g.41398  ORF Transcript_13723/g.41398 Transcript_13723/m.41398 type:complete len:233 (-) Transcript_13723:1371-2069(-)
MAAHLAPEHERIRRLTKRSVYRRYVDHHSTRERTQEVAHEHRSYHRQSQSHHRSHRHERSQHRSHRHETLQHRSRWTRHRTLPSREQLHRRREWVRADTTSPVDHVHRRRHLLHDHHSQTRHHGHRSRHRRSLRYREDHLRTGCHCRSRRTHYDGHQPSNHRRRLDLGQCHLESLVLDHHHQRMIHNLNDVEAIQHNDHALMNHHACSNTQTNSQKEEELCADPSWLLHVEP